MPQSAPSRPLAVSTTPPPPADGAAGLALGASEAPVGGAADDDDDDAACCWAGGCAGEVGPERVDVAGGELRPSAAKAPDGLEPAAEAGPTPGEAGLRMPLLCGSEAAEVD